MVHASRHYPYGGFTRLLSQSLFVAVASVAAHNTGNETRSNFPAERVLAPKFLNVSKENGQTLDERGGAR